MKKIIATLILAANSFFQPALAANVPADDQAASGITNVEILTEVGAIQREIEEAMAPIKSVADLKRHLENATDSPLNKLSVSARKNFLSSLVFTRDGLGSYSYIDLEGLAVTDAYKILSLFGAQHSVSSIPNIKPKDQSEEWIFALSDRLYGAQSVIRNHECIVNGADTDPTRCSYIYGRNCNSLCNK